MRKFITLSLVFFLFGKLGLAAPASTTSTGLGKTVFTPGFALPIAADTGETGGGLALGFLFQTEPSSKLYAGVDLGLTFWGKAYSATESTSALQLLPTAVYYLSSKPGFTPFIGLSAGPYWYVAQAAGAPGIEFVLLFRPGVVVPVSSSLSLNVELKYGGIGGAFLFMPTVSLNINL